MRFGDFLIVETWQQAFGCRYVKKRCIADVQGRANFQLRARPGRARRGPFARNTAGSPGALAARVVNGDAPHRLGGDGEKVRSPTTLHEYRLSHQRNASIPTITQSGFLGHILERRPAESEDCCRKCEETSRVHEGTSRNRRDGCHGRKASCREREDDCPSREDISPGSKEICPGS
jgi:hypothetical protein